MAAVDAQHLHQDRRLTYLDRLGSASWPGVVCDEAAKGGQDPGGVLAELDHAGAMTAATDDQQALVAHPGRPVHQPSLLGEGQVVAADDEQHRDPSRSIAASASTPPNPEAPDRLTTAATGGRIRVAADSTAVPPIEEPTSTTWSAPRRRS
jgi:hypothetical protein